ncbi:MAG TPA: PilZ domain-containing protein [Nitrospiraceae bacterium]|nr:PilZ domain-containing protein [Nitrospiraceae bacterium]
MESSASNRIELRRHERYFVPDSCLLSFSQFTLSISFSGDAEGEGIIVNLSPKGCKVESEATVKVSEAMSLIILLPDQKTPTTVDLALVRWVKDDAFGLEFISMGANEASRIFEYLTDMEKRSKPAP